MIDEDTSTLYDASIVVTFSGDVIEEADEKLEELLDWCYEKGYDVEVGVLEESITIEEE